MGQWDTLVERTKRQRDQELLHANYAVSVNEAASKAVEAMMEKTGKTVNDAASKAVEAMIEKAEKNEAKRAMKLNKDKDRGQPPG